MMTLGLDMELDLQLDLDLVQELGPRALGWIVQHVDRFFERPSGERGDVTRVKRIAELALVMGTLRERPEAAALLRRAWDEVGAGAQIAEQLAISPVAAASYLPFRLAGLRSSALERKLLEPGWRQGHALWPHFGKLAIGATLERINCAPPWDQAQVIANTRLLVTPSAKTPGIQAAFLAHAVMWRTEMGRNRQALGPKTIALYRGLSRAWHPQLGARALLDPLGEMVIADVCSGGSAPPASLEQLAAAQHRDGAMPAHPSATDTSFDALYHSTCVAALAGCLAIRKPARPSPDFAIGFAD